MRSSPSQDRSDEAGAGIPEIAASNIEPPVPAGREQRGFHSEAGDANPLRDPMRSALPCRDDVMQPD